MSALRVIPPITHELGRNWDQPRREEIEITDVFAVMSEQTFKALAEYSGSFPTGVYEGKMWKRHDGIFDRRFLAAGGKPEWLLMWFGLCDDPNKVSNNSRKIIFRDEYDLICDLDRQMSQEDL